MKTVNNNNCLLYNSTDPPYCGGIGKLQIDKCDLSNVKFTNPREANCETTMSETFTKNSCNVKCLVI
jgi:hypothetical protein